MSGLFIPVFAALGLHALENRNKLDVHAIAIGIQAHLTITSTPVWVIGATLV